MSRLQACRCPGGFTLLELLVALAVFAVIAAAAYGGLHSIVLTRSAVETEAQRLAQVQMAFYFLEQDTTQMVQRGIRDEFGLSQPPVQSGGLDGNLITFTRGGWDNPLRRPRSTLQRLAYRLEKDRLLRVYWDTLDRLGTAEPRVTILLDNVREARIRFLDDNDAWNDSWPPPARSGETAAPPRAVEITLRLGDWGDITRLFPVPGT